METNSEYFENQPLKALNEVVVQGEKLSEDEYPTNLPIYNSHFPTRLQPYPQFSNPQLEKRQPHLFQSAFQPQDAQASYNSEFQPVYQLPNFPMGNLKEGQAYALYIKDGATFLQPYQLPTSEIPCACLTNFDRTMKENTLSYDRIFLYINVIIGILNFIPSLVFAITNAQISLWLAFGLNNFIIVNGLFEILVIYYKKSRISCVKIAIFLTYITFYLIVIVSLGLDMQPVRGRYIQVKILILIIFRGVKVAYLVIYMIHYVGYIWMMLLNQKHTQDELTKLKLTKQ